MSQDNASKNLRTTLVVLGGLAALVAIADTGKEPVFGRRHIFPNELLRAAVFTGGVATALCGAFGGKKR